MGKALELLGAAGCLEAARELVPDYDQQKTRDLVLWARCPMHADTNPSWRYQALEDLWTCYAGCAGGPSGASSGDLIDLFCALRGLDRSDGFAAFLERFAPGTRLEPRERAKRQAAAPAPAPEFAPRAKIEPPAYWQKQCGAWVRRCSLKLASSPTLMRRVAEWGLTRETVQRLQIGWNLADDYHKVTAWGLPFATGQSGREKRIWLPEGLVVPFFRLGRLQSVKVRLEHPEKLPESMRDLRYFEILGSSTRFFVFGPEGEDRVAAAVVVETERDAALVRQEVQRLPLPVWTMATGGAGKRPDAYAHYILSRAEVILNGLDTDRAGAQSHLGWWEETYAHNLRLPVPRGILLPSGKPAKDAGDLVGRVDIAAWILARLPGYVRDRWGLYAPAPAAAIQAAPEPAPAEASPPAGLAELGPRLAG